MSRYDLTDFEWRVIEPLLPNKPRGVLRVDDRRVLNGILWVLRSGAPWRTCPSAWSAHDSDIQMIDSTSVRAHQQSATAKRRGADHCLGRSRGGLTTKIHVVVDSQGLPIRLGPTAGQTHNGQIADTLLNHLRPRTIVLADKAYDADRIRELIQDQGPLLTSRRRATGAGNPALANGSTASATSSSVLLKAETLPPCRHPL